MQEKHGQKKYIPLITAAAGALSMLLCAFGASFVLFTPLAAAFFALSLLTAKKRVKPAIAAVMILSAAGGSSLSYFTGFGIAATLLPLSPVLAAFAIYICFNKGVTRTVTITVTAFIAAPSALASVYLALSQHFSAHGTALADRISSFLNNPDTYLNACEKLLGIFMTPTQVSDAVTEITPVFTQEAVEATTASLVRVSIALFAVVFIIITMSATAIFRSIAKQQPEASVKAEAWVIRMKRISAVLYILSFLIGLLGASNIFEISVLNLFLMLLPFFVYHGLSGLAYRISHTRMNPLIVIVMFMLILFIDPIRLLYYIGLFGAFFSLPSDRNRQPKNNH